MKMIMKLAPAAALAAVLSAQNPFRAESTSSISFTAKGDERAIEIHNVAWQYSNTRVPGRPPDQQLTLRTVTHSKDMVGDIPEPGLVTLDAWPFGVDPKQKPIYTVKIGGSEAKVVDNALWVINRGYTDMDLWSIYKLGTGQHMFDTHAEMLRFSITPDVQTMRYAGLDVPADDVADARLKEPHVLAVVTYAAEDRIIRELLLTHTSPQRARELRSYADITQTLTLTEKPTRRLRIGFKANERGAATVEVMVPIKGDDLDMAGAQLPPGFKAAAWKR